jgi:aldose 1-epimerase
MAILLAISSMLNAIAVSYEQGFTYSGEGCRCEEHSASGQTEYRPQAEKCMGRMTMRWLRIMLLSMTTAMAAHGSVTKTAFGTAPDGTAVELYTLKSEGIEASITTFGARVVSIMTPDRDGKIADVVLGYSSLDGYVADKSTYFGAIVGRYGNRIAFGKFSLDGHQYQIPTNNGANSLHGGTVGFDRMVWQARAIAD